MAEKSGEGGEKKSYNKEDILSAGDVGGVLENYRRASEQVHQHYERSGLQVAAADRLHQLGDEEKSFQFTILACQSQNAERTNRAAEIMGEVGGDFHRDMSSLGSVSREVKESGHMILTASEKIQSAGDNLSRSASNMDAASRTIDTASRRIDSAAGTIHEASIRMK